MRRAKPAAPRVTADLTQLNFNYEVKRDKQFPWQPAQVFDDGAHVYIKLPEAARNAEAPALFMVADGTGGHAFAETADQHNANVARWYAIRRERGEM